MTELPTPESTSSVRTSDDPPSPRRFTVDEYLQMAETGILTDDDAVQTQSTLPLDDRNAPEPDLAILRGSPDDLMQGELPAALVIEVADTSLERDRTVKQPLYARAGIPAYWIVNLADREIEVYTDPSRNRYRERTTRVETETVDVPIESVDPIEGQALLPASEGEAR